MKRHAIPLVRGRRARRNLRLSIATWFERPPQTEGGGDGAGRGDLQRLASSLGLADAIHFTGMVEEARMRDLLRAAAIYVSVSPLDAGLASSTAEAMSIGLPVVITDVGDNRLWVPEGEGGFLVDGGDREAVARAVNRLLADAGVRRSFGERNRQKIIEDYNVDVELARIEQAYEDATASGPTAR